MLVVVARYWVAAFVREGNIFEGVRVVVIAKYHAILELSGEGVCCRKMKFMHLHGTVVVELFIQAKLNPLIS